MLPTLNSKNSQKLCRWKGFETITELLLDKSEISLSFNEKGYKKYCQNKRNVHQRKLRENVYSKIKDDALNQTV